MFDHYEPRHEKTCFSHMRNKQKIVEVRTNKQTNEHTKRRTERRNNIPVGVNAGGIINHISAVTLSLYIS